MCHWLSWLVVKSCSATATTANEGGAEHATSDGTDRTGYKTCDPDGPRLHGGEGPPRYCETLAGPKDFHDGGGLCSLGRWPQDRRRLGRLVLAKERAQEAGPQLCGDRERLGERGLQDGRGHCKLVRNKKLQSDMVQLLCSWLEAQDLGEKGLDKIPDGRLRLLRRILEAAGDPDREGSAWASWIRYRLCMPSRSSLGAWSQVRPELFLGQGACGIR